MALSLRHNIQVRHQKWAGPVGWSEGLEEEVCVGGGEEGGGSGDHHTLCVWSPVRTIKSTKHTPLAISSAEAFVTTTNISYVIATLSSSAYPDAVPLSRSLSWKTTKSLSTSGACGAARVWRLTLCSN